VAYLDQRAVKVTIPAGFTASELPPLSVPTPKWALTFSLNYTLPWKLADGQLVIDYNYFWTDSFFAQDTLIPSYDLHNARLSWNNIANGPVSIDFFINNILDKRYITAAVNLQQGIANYGEPRMFGVDLNVKFH
jgi:outer membrane receptor protein involved in Fe transport